MNEIVIKHFLCKHARGSGYELVQYEAQQGVWWCAVIIRDSVCRANGAACPQHPNLAHTQTITVPCWAPSESDPRLSPLWHSSAAMVFVHIRALAGLPAAHCARAFVPGCLACCKRASGHSHRGGCEVTSRTAPSPWNFTNVNEWGWIAAMPPISHAQIYSLRPREIMLLPLALHQWQQFHVCADKPARPVPAAALSSRAGCYAYGSDVPTAGTWAMLNCSVTQNSSRDWELTVISLSFPCCHLPTAHIFVHHQ